VVQKMRFSSELRDGDTVTATVTGTLREFAVILDVGTELPALMKMEEFAEGFPLRGWPPEVGTRLEARILGRDRKGFELTMRPGGLERPPRKPKRPKGSVSAFAEVSPNEWLDGEVQGMTKWGVFVEVSPPRGGQAVAGLLHKEAIKEDLAKTLLIGSRVRVRVAAVDVAKQRLELTV